MKTDQKKQNTDWGAIYLAGAFLTGVLTFAGVWIYAMSEWGFLIGIIFGWIPAIIAAFVFGFIWPILALGIGALILLGVLSTL